MIWTEEEPPGEKKKGRRNETQQDLKVKDLKRCMSRKKLSQEVVIH